MTEPSLWQRVADKLRSQADRLTHTRSRKQAQLRARRRGRPRRIVVLCYGNICRSPYAEAYLRHRLGQDGVTNVSVESAGIIGPDRPANRQGAATALSRGFDLSDHRSRLFTDEDAGMTDLVLVMTRNHRDHLIRRFGMSRERIELLGDFDVEDPPYREISDPYGLPEEEFKRVFGQIERSVEGLCAAWREPTDRTRDAFNSFVFLFLFLPITYLVFWRLKTAQARYVWLALTGYLFYGYARGVARKVGAPVVEVEGRIPPTSRNFADCPNSPTRVPT